MPKVIEDNYEENHAGKAHIINRVTWWGLVINVVLSGLKMLAGIYGGCQALIADAVHSLSDLTTDAAVLIGVRYWSAPADKRHPYGHGRIETIVSLVIGMALFAVAVYIGYDSMATYNGGDVFHPDWWVFGAALVSIVSKEWLYRWTVNTGKRIKSSALMANAWHHRSDAFSSIPVAIAVLISMIYPNDYIDHIAALMVSVLILKAAWSIMSQAFEQLIDAGADAACVARLRDLAFATQGVRDVHKIRTRNIGSGLQVDMHVLVDPAMTVLDSHNIAVEVQKRLVSAEKDVIDVLVHIEPYEEGGNDDD